MLCRWLNYVNVTSKSEEQPRSVMVTISDTNHHASRMHHHTITKISCCPRYCSTFTTRKHQKEHTSQEPEKQKQRKIWTWQAKLYPTIRPRALQSIARTFSFFATTPLSPCHPLATRSPALLALTPVFRENAILGRGLRKPTTTRTTRSSRSHHLRASHVELGRVIAGMLVLDPLNWVASS